MYGRIILPQKNRPVVSGKCCMHGSVGGHAARFTTINELRREFGREVELLVRGVTKISLIGGMSKSVQQAEPTRKMLLAMVEDLEGKGHKAWVPDGRPRKLLFITIGDRESV